jgi:hypothetical protein
MRNSKLCSEAEDFRMLKSSENSLIIPQFICHPGIDFGGHSECLERGRSWVPLGLEDADEQLEEVEEEAVPDGHRNLSLAAVLVVEYFG